MITTPIGPIPFTLEDLSPWCHLTGPDTMWLGIYNEEEIAESLDEFGLSGLPVTRASPNHDPGEIIEHRDEIREWLDRCAVVDKLALLCGVNPLDGCKLTEDMSSRKSRTDRMVNVYSGSDHILSPRLTDGGISLTLVGASRLNQMQRSPPPEFGDEPPDEVFSGIPRVCVVDDAIPFVGIGRNVIQGYVSGADSHLVPGQPCLVVDSQGNLVAHGTALSPSWEMAFMRKGIAVKVRDGAMKKIK